MNAMAAFVTVLAAAAAHGSSSEGGGSKSRGLLLVANKGDHTLGIIDPVEGRQVAAVVQSGVTGHEVVASPDGRTAYVPIYGDSGVGRPGSDGRTLDVIDLRSRRLVKTVDLGRPERPHCPQFGPDGRLYVSTELTDTVTVLDPGTLAVVDRLPTGQPESHMLVLTKVGTRAYTSNVHAGTVSAIDVAAKKVLAVIPVTREAQRLALSVDERWLFTADQKEPRLGVIDTTTNTLARFVALPGIAYGTAPTPDGKYLVVTLRKASRVLLVDLHSMEVTRTVDVPKEPQMVVIPPDGRVAYVSCDLSGQVAEIDLRSFQVARLIQAGPLADGLAWAPAH
jgi:YVTN family beta-propeller protein